MVMSNSTASSNTLDAAGAGIVGGYDGSSFTLRVLIILFPTLAMYNAVELLTLVFVTFHKYQGLYFWSLLVASLGIIPYSLGFLLKFNHITVGNLSWLSVVLLTIGWYTMVTGQSVVLWSRLHLLVSGIKGDRTLRWTKWMIIINVFILHVPTTVLTFGSNGSLSVHAFVRAYGIMEKIQMSGFFLQEVILSTLYIMAAIRILRTSIRDDTKKIMYQLFAINVLIIIMDLALLGLEAASLYLLETTTKGVFYSVKLKLEFAILGKLVQFVGRPGTSVVNDRHMSVQFPKDYNTANFSRNNSTQQNLADARPAEMIDLADLSQSSSKTACVPVDPSLRSQSLQDGSTLCTSGNDENRPRKSSTRLRPGISPDEVDLALFEHTADAPLPSNEALGGGYGDLSNDQRGMFYSSGDGHEGEV